MKNSPHLWRTPIFGPSASQQLPLFGSLLRLRVAGPRSRSRKRSRNWLGSVGPVGAQRLGAAKIGDSGGEKKFVSFLFFLGVLFVFFLVFLVCFFCEFLRFLKTTSDRVKSVLSLPFWVLKLRKSTSAWVQSAICWLHPHSHGFFLAGSNPI